MDLVMLALLIIFLVIILYKIKIGKDVENSFTDKKQAGVIKGICCIIVVLVHIPVEHGNIIQDVIGSLGYICVTIFFLLSAYGLKYSVKNKKDYLKNFIRNRILVIYIPFVIANIIWELVLKDNGFDILRVIGLRGVSFVSELIIFYVLFYLVYKNIKDSKKADVLMIILVIIISIIAYFLNVRWYIEPLGFAYGIIIFNFLSKINKISEKHWGIKILFLLTISAILGLVYIKMKNVEFINHFIKIILAIAIISFAIVLFRRVRIYNKILEILGKISYEVFLLHVIVINMLMDLPVSSGWYIGMVLIVTVISSYFMNIVDVKISNKLKTI